jgi:hypothetical protein
MEEYALKKPNWVCSDCGMWSSRKSSVKRHIQNIHDGNGSFVSFIDYLVGRKMGYYLPSLPPTYITKKSVNSSGIDYFSICKEELLKGAIRKQFQQY